jgi:hypothetical protein
MSGCEPVGPYSAHMSEGAIGTRSEELEDWVDRIVSKVRFEDTKKMIIKGI